MAFGFKVSGVEKDPDAVFEPRGSTTARADIKIWKGTPASRQNWSDRYCTSNGSDSPSGTSNLKVRLSEELPYVDVLTLFRAKATAIPTFTSSSGDGAFSFGDTVTLQVTTTNATSWAWYKAGVLIPGQTGQSYSFAYDENESAYSCVATNSFGSKSENFYVYTYVPPSPPVVSGITGGGTVDYGDTVTLTVIVVDGTGPFSYSWSGPSGAISGDVDSIGFTATTSSAGTYTCTVTNSDGSDYGSTSLIVIPPPPYCQIDQSPTAVTAGVANGESWSFSAEAQTGTTLAQVRFRVGGQDPSWTPYTGTLYTGSVSWGPLGSPSIFNSPGTYDLIIEAIDSNGKSDSDSVTITVS